MPLPLTSSTLLRFIITFGLIDDSCKESQMFCRIRLSFLVTQSMVSMVYYLYQMKIVASSLLLFYDLLRIFHLLFVVVKRSVEPIPSGNAWCITTSGKRKMSGRSKKKTRAKHGFLFFQDSIGCFRRWP